MLHLMLDREYPILAQTPKRDCLTDAQLSSNCFVPLYCSGSAVDHVSISESTKKGWSKGSSQTFKHTSGHKDRVFIFKCIF